MDSSHRYGPTALQEPIGSSNKIHQESERSTDTAVSIYSATTLGSSDDGSACFRGQQQPSKLKQQLGSDSTPGFPSKSELSEHAAKTGGLVDGNQQTDHPASTVAYDPYSYSQSSSGRQDSLDFHLEEGDMFLSDSEAASQRSESFTEAKRGSLDEAPPLDLDTPPSSLDFNRQTKLARSGGINGLAIMAPKKGIIDQLSSPLSVTASYSTAQGSQLTPSNLTPLASRPMLYSAIGSLENASANSFGKIHSQYKAFSQREFDGTSTPSTLAPPPPTSRVEKSATPKKSTSKTQNEAAISEALLMHEEKKQDTPTLSNAESSKSSDAVAARTNHVSAESADRAKEKTLAKVGPKLPEKKPAGVLLDRKHLKVGQQTKSSGRKTKKVTIEESAKDKQKKKPKEMFRPSCDAYTPRMGKKSIEYKPAEMRTPVQKMSTTMGTLSRPNFRDALRRVAMIIQQHIVKIERRFEGGRARGNADGLFSLSMLEDFSEDNFATPRYRCTMVRLPMARPGMIFGMRKLDTNYSVPTEQEIYEFGHQLFNSVQLSSECSIVCLIYVERLMEIAKVPLVARTWRPIFMCGLLLASKVWQDLSSWNIEFASVYPQFSLEAINRLELHFLKMIKWDLYISSSLYAKYYFALRSLLEKQDFRMRYNRMVVGVSSVNASEALKVQQRSEQVKEEALLQLSRSM